MAAITWADVTAIAAALAGVNPTAQAAILSYANASFNPAMFDGEDGATLKLVRVLVAAHFATLALQASSGAAGPVVSESLGGLSVSYAVIGGPDAGGKWSGSMFAELLNTLVRTSGARIPIVA